MAPRRRRSKSLAAQSIALGFAVPQVIAHRMARMGDPREMHLMGSEKIAAATEAWSAMAAQAILENQKLALSMMQSLWFPWMRRSSASRQLSDAALSILGKGMAPVSRRAVANAKRLGRAKRR
ncbi:MAG TPA: hypothetical protein VL982_12845 [Burkholderiales bacterium]|jgi:hypothetical protein|nr:hypothetical protein [Burkholderiales bacterium]